MSRSFFQRILSQVKRVWGKEQTSSGVSEVQGNQRDKPIIADKSALLKWGDHVAKNIMRARADVIAVDSRISLRELVAVFKDTAYSRIPVYEGDLDQIIGVVYAKDLLGCFGIEDFPDWKKLMRPPFFIPENKRVDSLFADFQANNTHFAIVVNEYGAMQGIVTMEDALEDLLGEIHDEYDEPNGDGYTKMSDKVYVFEARTSIENVCKVLNIKEQQFEDIRNGADTLGGLLMAWHGAVPPPQTEITMNGIQFKVLAGSLQRIQSIQIILP